MSENKKEVSMQRSFTAQYLTFVASTGDSEESIEGVMKMKIFGLHKR